MPLFVLLAAAGSFFGFANPLWRFPPLILLVPGCLAAIGAHASSGRQAFRTGYLAGVLGAASTLYWAALPVHDFGNLPWILAAPCPVLMALALGVYTGLFSLAAHSASRRMGPLAAGLSCGVFYAAMELARGRLLTGFPWLTLPGALVPIPEAIQAASLAGTYGLAGIYAAAAALLLIPGRRALTIPAGLALLAATAIGGGYLLDAPQPGEASADIAVIQGNVDQSRKWDKAFQQEILDRYLALTESEIKAARPRLAIWPETSMPFYFQPATPDDRFSRAVKDIPRKTGTAILAGGPAESDAGGKPILYNRAYLITPPDAAPGFYDKLHLVPFGEYIPFGEYLPFLSKLVEGVGDFVPGASAGPLRLGGLALGVLICYEGIFPEAAQERTEAGSNLLVNLSNDAWYGRSSAARQHLELAALRAVEQGVWLIRATNTGISAAVDPKGRIIAPTGMFTAESRTYAGVGLRRADTFFHRHYAWIQSAIVVMTLILLVFPLPGRSRPLARGSLRR